ncbi:MAG: hypothetical protein RXQ76_04245 [Acidianus sp.]
MLDSSTSIDKFFKVHVYGYIPKSAPTIAVTYVTFYVRIKANKVAHANLLCIGITDGYKTISISKVVDNEFIKKHRDLMVNSNLNGFKFGIYFIFVEDGKGNKKIYLFDQPFDPATLDKLPEKGNDQEAINYFLTKFGGECSKLELERDEKGLKTFYFVYNVKGKAKELDFKEENGKITILGFKQTKKGRGK